LAVFSDLETLLGLFSAARRVFGKAALALKVALGLLAAAPIRAKSLRSWVNVGVYGFR